MLAAAMRRNRFLFRHEMIAESPRNRSCTAAPRLALAIPQLAYERRMSALTRRRGLGVSKRNEYGPVVYVPPVACRVGVVFGGNRRISHPGFSKVSSRRRALRSRALRRSSRPAALRLSSLSAHRARIALGCRRGANAAARLCRHPCQPAIEPCFRRHGHVRLVRAIKPPPPTPPLHPRPPPH